MSQSSPSIPPFLDQRPQETLLAIRSCCLSMLLANKSHTIGFPLLTPAPQPVLSPLCALSPEEETLLSLWDELRDVLHERIRLQAREELARTGVLNCEGITGGRTRDGEEEEEEDVEEKQAEIVQEMRRLEEEVTRLQLDEAIKERMSLATLTGREVTNTVYGLGADCSPASVVKSRALRSLLHQHSSLISLATNLHNRITSLHSSLHEMKARNIAQTSENRLLTARLLRLTSQLSSRQRKENISDERLRELIDEKELALKEAKMRWEVARNVFQGIVVASGVDWVRVEDGRLRELVLEAGEELE